MALLCLCELCFQKQWSPTVHCPRIEIEPSKKLTDCLRERKERGNEKRLSCWVLADECVLSHYSHTAQYAGQSGDNECSVWYLAFLPPSLPPRLVCSLCCVLSLSSPLYTAEFSTVSNIFAFSGFNYLAISSGSIASDSLKMWDNEEVKFFCLLFHKLITDLRSKSIQCGT